LAKLTVAPSAAGSVGAVVSVGSGGWVGASVVEAAALVGWEAGVSVAWFPQADNNPTIIINTAIFMYIDFIFYTPKTRIE
jgi:hypothetical protein